MRKQSVTPELISIGQRLRDIAITVGCSCKPTNDYAEYCRLMEVLMSTARDSQTRFALWLSHPYEGKMVDEVCDVCKTINEWDDVCSHPTNGVKKALTKARKKDKVLA